MRGREGWSRRLKGKRWMDGGSLLLKGQVFLLQLMFYLLSSETEPDRGALTDEGFRQVSLNKKRLY